MTNLYRVQLASHMNVEAESFEDALAKVRANPSHYVEKCGLNGYPIFADENGEEVKQSPSYADSAGPGVRDFERVAELLDRNTIPGPTGPCGREDPATVVQGDPEGELIRVLDGQVHPDDADKYEAAMQRAHRAITTDFRRNDDFYTKPKTELLGMELTPSHEAILEDARTEFPTAVFAAPETIRIGDVVLSRADMFPALPAGRHRWFAAPITSMPYLLGLLEGSYTNGGVLIVRGKRSQAAKLHVIELTKDDLAKMAPMDIQGAQDMLDAKHGPRKYLVTTSLMESGEHTAAVPAGY